MDGLVQSIRSRARRPWVLGLVGMAAAVGGFLLVSTRGGPPSLELVTVDADGAVHDKLTMEADDAQTVSSAAPGSVTRIPLTLAVRNSGGEAVRPDRLELSLPRHLRISTSAGKTLRGKGAPGNPLVRYRLPGPFPVIEPGSAPTPITQRDNLWLELTTSPVYCVVLADSVPEFLAAPESRTALGNIQIFYSFEGGELERRQTGLLAVALDPALLEREATEPPPTFPTEIQDTGSPLPSMSALSYVGSTKADCGAPEQPVQLFSTLWETPGGGRFFAIDYGGITRKYLFDLNGDDVIELEMWDAQGTGRFEARRKAQLPIPPFLIPGEEVRERHDPNVFANVPRDSLGNYDRFRQTIAGGSTAIRPRSNAGQQRHRPLAGSGDREREGTGRASERPTEPPLIGRDQPSSSPPATGRRPDRARRAEPAPPTPLPWRPDPGDRAIPRERTRPPEPTPNQPAPPRQTWPEPPREPERPAAEPQRERPDEDEGPRLLGVPVDSIRPTSHFPEPETEPEPDDERRREPPGGAPDRNRPANEPDPDRPDEPEAEQPEAEPENEPRAEPDEASGSQPRTDPDADEPDNEPRTGPDAEPSRDRRRP